MKLPIFLACIFLISPLAFSTTFLQLSEPDVLVFDGAMEDYGSVGPGQTFTVQIQPLVKDDNGEYVGQWDIAYATGLPAGWTSKQSKIYDNPLIVEITSAPRTPEGNYYVSITAIDETGQEEIGGNISFTMLVNVRHDVLDMEVTP
ncbi:MAG: hypothetical protein ABIH83_03260 [Candidatus Micrarchaeota archaeon]